MNGIIDYITKENITFILATIGSVGTIYSFINSLINNRTNFTVESNGHLLTSRGLLLHIQIINHSKLPLTITGVSILVNNIELFASAIPEKVLETETRNNGLVVEHNSHYSMSLPISLSSSYGTSGYFYFQFPEDIAPQLSNQVNLKVFANKNKVTEISLELGPHLR